MSTQAPTPPPRPIFARAADNGLYLGLYICAMVLALGFSLSFTPAVLVVYGGTIGLPFFVYRMLRRSSTAAAGRLSFPELWAEGIATFFLGTLLPALTAYLCLRFIAPTFIADTLSYAIAVFESQDTPEWNLWAETLRDTTAQSGLPTPVDVAAQLISFNIIVGTALSFFSAIAVTFMGKATSTEKQ